MFVLQTVQNDGRGFQDTKTFASFEDVCKFTAAVQRGELVLRAKYARIIEVQFEFELKHLR